MDNNNLLPNNDSFLEEPPDGPPEGGPQEPTPPDGPTEGGPQEPTPPDGPTQGVPQEPTPPNKENTNKGILLDSLIGLGIGAAATGGTTAAIINNKKKKEQKQIDKFIDDFPSDSIDE